MWRKVKFSSAGKIPNKFLNEIVFKHLGSPSDYILYGPGIGRDAAAIKLSNDKILIVKSDPITGSVRHIGRYAVIINANDIAVLGATPMFFLSTILLPINASLYDLEIICQDIDKAAKELNISVIGGHSEVTAGIMNPILCGSMLGETSSEKLITANSRHGDKLVMTKFAAIEGTAILAWDKEDFLQKKMKKNSLETAKKFINYLSILKDAQLALKIGGITAMHDPTEGGILNGIFEICKASGVGAIVYKERIPIAKETQEICKILNLNPLRLISSGTLLLTIKPQNLTQIITILAKHRIKATCIGEIRKEKEIHLLRDDGTQELIAEHNQDQLWTVFSK
ncbi:MAG: AIR synthase family protein [Candidatus Helarchaeota archaeon]